MADRNSFINSGVNQYGLTSKEINSALKQAGYPQLNKIETTLIDEGKWGTTTGERFKEGMKAFGIGASTLLSEVAQHPVRSAKELGRYVSENSLPHIMGDFYEAVAKPLQLDAESLGANYAEGGLKGIGEGVIAGAVSNPADTLLITAPAWGRGVAKGAKAVARKAENLPIPEWLKKSARGAISTEGKEVNQILRDVKSVSAPDIEHLKSVNVSIKNAKPENLSQAIRNLEEGILEGTPEQIELTSQLKGMTTKIDEMLQKAGFNPDYSRAETINQYATRYFQKQGKDIPVSQIEKLLNDSELAKKYGTTIEEVQGVLEQGDKLYREGFIRPIKHNTTAQTKREGFVSEAEKKVRDPNAKMYGTQTYEDVAEGIKTGAYDNIIKTLEKAENSVTALDEMIGVVGKAVQSLDEIANLGKDEVLVSPRLLREKISTALAGGEGVTEPLQSITRGLNKAEALEYADDLKVLKKADLEALQKAYNVGNKQKGLGLFGDIAGIGKSIALATPRYIAGNTTTNFLMNPITGTHIGHYIKALESIINHTDDIPEILKRTASYSGYLGDTLPIRAGYKDIYNKLLNDLKEGNWSTKMQAINAMANTPIFKGANMAETIQRSAEYLNQAEKYAKEVNKTIEQVLEEAKANNGLNKTYRAINQRVEEILGDYTGRNYYAPEGLTNIANVMMPFYRPFTQAPRQMFNATIKYPIGTQIGFNAPSKLGNQISEYGKEEYGIEPYESFGGSPVLAPTGNMPGRVLYNQYHAFSPVAEMITNPMGVFQGNPFLGEIYNIGAGRTRYGEAPLPPNAYRLADGSIAVMDNNGNVMPYDPEKNMGDRVRFQLSEAIKTLTPVSALNSYILPNIALLTGQSYTRPADTVPLGQVGDLRLPGIMEGSTGRNRTTEKELILPQLGFNYADTYPERREEYTPSQVKSTRKKILKRQAKNERR